MAMNRKELVAAVAERSGNTQAAVSDVLDALFEVFTAQVKKGEKVSIPGWLAVERTERKERTGRNPRTGDAVTVEEKYVPFFKTGKLLRDRLNAE